MKFSLDWSKLSFNGKLLLAISLLQALVVIAVEIVISVEFISNVNVSDNAAQEGSGKSITVYLFIYIFTQVYQLVIIVDAIWGQNTIQVFAHVIFCACMVGFSIFQLFQIRDALYSIRDSYETTDPEYTFYQNLFNFLLPFLIASIIVLFLCFCFFAYLSFKLYLEFGWKIYKKIGADPKKREMYRAYQILIMLLKFALYFFIAYAIQFLVLVLKPTDPEFGLTIAAIFIAPGIAYVVVIALRRENRILMGLWVVVILLALAYFAFKIGRIYDPSQAYKYIGSGKFLTLFAALGFIVFGITLVFTIITIRNFGKGLKAHFSEPAPDSLEQNQNPTNTSTAKPVRTMVLA